MLQRALIALGLFDQIALISSDTHFRTIRIYANDYITALFILTLHWGMAPYFSNLFNEVNDHTK